MSIYVKDAAGNRTKIAGIGLPGPVGKSAYQYAVEGGFSGTEAEFRALMGVHSNENLLDNWYFPDPINQRGQEEYTGRRIYCIDRWALHAGNTTFNTKSHTIKTYANTNWCGIYQYLDNSSMFIRKTLTFSALLSTDTELWIRIAYGPSETDHFISTIPSGASGCFSVTGVIPQNTTQLGVQIVKKNAGTSDGTIVPEAVKFELGPVQTLAHKEGDTWVLNDPPPDKTLEFLKCRRYFKSIGGRDTHISGYRYYSLSTGVVCNVPDVPMRATPALSRGNISNIVAVQNGVSYAVSSVEALSEKIFRFLTEKEIPERGPVSIYCNDTVFLNADL